MRFGEYVSTRCSAHVGMSLLFMFPWSAGKVSAANCMPSPDSIQAGREQANSGCLTQAFAFHQLEGQAVRFLALANDTSTNI